MFFKYLNVTYVLTYTLFGKTIRTFYYIIIYIYVIQIVSYSYRKSHAYVRKSISYI